MKNRVESARFFVFYSAGVLFIQLVTLVHLLNCFYISSGGLDFNS